MNKLNRQWAKDCKKRGVEEPIPKDIFDAHLKSFSYPFPKEISWNVREKFALEEYYMGEGISGTVFERYDGFLKSNIVSFEDLSRQRPYTKKSDDEKIDKRANRYFLSDMGYNGIKSIITSMFVWTVKNEESSIFGQEMARINLEDPWANETVLICFPEAWQQAQERMKVLTKNESYKIEPGLALHFNGWFQWENSHTYSIILSDIIGYKESPKLPSDLKSRKIKMPRKQNITKEDIVNLDPEEFVEVLEDMMVEDGIGYIEDDDDRPDPFRG
ncbi:MAG: hypothetical protein HC877_24265 [Thioploca sp.]|nr:hypothetical protein [Thioploca sp.]